jgi:hypothetical protein
LAADSVLYAGTVVAALTRTGRPPIVGGEHPNTVEAYVNSLVLGVGALIALTLMRALLDRVNVPAPYLGSARAAAAVSDVIILAISLCSLFFLIVAPSVPSFLVLGMFLLFYSFRLRAIRDS